MKGEGFRHVSSKWNSPKEWIPRVLMCCLTTMAIMILFGAMMAITFNVHLKSAIHPGDTSSQDISFLIQCTEDNEELNGQFSGGIRHSSAVSSLDILQIMPRKVGLFEVMDDSDLLSITGMYLCPIREINHNEQELNINTCGRTRLATTADLSDCHDLINTPFNKGSLSQRVKDLTDPESPIKLHVNGISYHLHQAGRAIPEGSLILMWNASEHKVKDKVYRYTLTEVMVGTDDRYKVGDSFLGPARRPTEGLVHLALVLKKTNKANVQTTHTIPFIFGRDISFLEDPHTTFPPPPL
jgi:hypothetical protein